MNRRKYSAEFRTNAVRRMNTPGQSVEELAKELGLSASLLFRWRRKAGSPRGVATQEKDDKGPPRRPQDWTSEQKLSVVLEAMSVPQEQLGGLLRQRGLHQATLDEWREMVLRGAKAELDGRRGPVPSAAVQRQLRELQHELVRKEKALAETAALLVLKKKVQAFLGDEDDDTEPRSGR